MARTEWLSEISRGRYKTELLELQLTHGAGRQFVGQGRLTWDAKSGTHIEAITDGSEAVIEIAFTPLQPGKLIPDDRYLGLQATTQDGLKIRVPRLLPWNLRCHTASPAVIWTWSERDICSPVFIERKVPSSDESALEALLAPVTARIWSRNSKRTYENARFKTERNALDWLEVGSKAGLVIVRKRPRGWIAVQVHPTSAEPDRITTALCFAFGLLVGQPVGIVAFEARQQHCAKGEIHRFPTRTANSYPRPFPSHANARGWFEPYLARAIDFFAGDAGSELGPLLNRCWDTVDHTFSTHALVACVTVEAFVGRLSRKAPLLRQTMEPEVKRLKALISGQDFSPHFTQRLYSLLGMIYEVPVKQVLREWQSGAILGVTHEDVNAWALLRNPTAHGGLPDVSQESVDALRRVHNLINKLALQAIGYRGRFFDYAVWQEGEFPLADEAQL